MRILLAAGVIRAGVRYPAPMLPTSKAIEAHLALISCENRKKPCGNDYSSATMLRYRTRMEKAYPTQDEFTAALKAKQKKLHRAKVDGIRAGIKERLGQRREGLVAMPPPRYDEVFEAGAAWIESLGGLVAEPLLKPSPRGRKAPKPIARGKRPARVRKTASGRAKHAADLAWAKAVRESGPCAALAMAYAVQYCDYQQEPHFHTHWKCIGQIEAAHIVSRRYAATRTDKANGMPLCHFIHGWFTEHPLDWDAFVIQKIGAQAFAALKAKALRGTK